MGTTQTTLRLTLKASTRARFARLGRSRGCTPDALAKQAIESWLAREEELEDMAREDLARWAEYLETGESHGLDEALKLLDALKSGGMTPGRK